MSTKKHNGHEDGHKCAAFLIRDKTCYDTSTISVLSLQNTPATFLVEFLVKDGSDNRKDQAKYQRPPEPCNSDAIYKATCHHHYLSAWCSLWSVVTFVTHSPTQSGHKVHDQAQWNEDCHKPVLRSKLEIKRLCHFNHQCILRFPNCQICQAACE